MIHPVPTPQQGFTLIELSIVLVIIGLIVGGVLVGQDLIRAAEVRATITQIEKYNTAVNTFRTKYNNQLPGDIDATDAAQFGFAARGPNAGQGDGNGVLEGYNNVAGGNLSADGELAMFWEDLSVASMIDGSFSTATQWIPTVSITGSGIDAYFPQAKIGQGNYIYVISGGTWTGVWNSTGINYFTLSAITSIDPNSAVHSAPGLTVQQAYSIDTKIDDGLPQSGNVTTLYFNYTLSTGGEVWAAGGGATGASPGTAASASSTSCYDNGGDAANSMQYSVSQNGGAGVNCALSFQFQ
jgi:prepilin-type N-terminal cleavage/methylation domain-containing protein